MSKHKHNVLRFDRNGESSKGDARFTLNEDASDVAVHGKHNLYVPVTAKDGTELRLTLRRNVYVPGGDNVESVTFHVTAGDVTRSATRAAPAEAAAASTPFDTAKILAESGQADAARRVLTALPGIGKGTADSILAAWSDA